MKPSIFPKLGFSAFVPIRPRGLALAAVICAMASKLSAGGGDHTFNSVNTNGNDGTYGLHVNSADAAIDGSLSLGNNLNVGGQASFSQNIQLGDSLNLNSYPSWYGFSGSSATVFFQQPDYATWLWQANPSGSWVTQMTLNAGDALILGDPSTSSNITIDPVGQTITFGDGLIIGETITTLFAGTGSESYLFGDGTANATYAIAMGPDSTASNTNALALINATASGANSIAMGGSATKATGSYAIALGSYANASGDYSLAFGDDIDTIASGTGAIALGTGVSAQTWSSITVGHYNTGITGTATSWASKDSAFMVGIGSDSSHTANGLVLLNNGIIYSGSGATTDSSTNMILGNGIYLEVVPQNGVFLAGNLTNVSDDSAWDSYGEVGIGYNVALSGPGAVAIGNVVNANSLGSVAIGWHAYTGQTSAVSIGDDNLAYADGDVAMGDSNGSDYGTGAVALGYYNTASYRGTVALGDENNIVGGFDPFAYAYVTAVGEGYKNNVIGAYATAIGGYNAVTGLSSTALGFHNAVVGGNSTALGANITITGDGTVALGANLTAIYDHTLVAGKYNAETSGLTVVNQPLFELGNGTAEASRSNAFMVMQNGDMTITGHVNMTKRQGDIIMGVYGTSGSGD